MTYERDHSNFAFRGALAGWHVTRTEWYKLSRNCGKSDRQNYCKQKTQEELLYEVVTSSQSPTRKQGPKMCFQKRNFYTLFKGIRTIPPILTKIKPLKPSDENHGYYGIAKLRNKLIRKQSVNEGGEYGKFMKVSWMQEN